MQLLYGKGGLGEIVTPVEEDILATLTADGAGLLYHVAGAATLGSPTITGVASTAGVNVGDVGFSHGAAITAVTVLSKTANTITFTGNLPTTEAVVVFLNPATTSDLYGSIVVLLTGALAPPTKGLNLATLLGSNPEATYDGYARSSAIVWGNPFMLPGGNGVVSGDKKQFVCTGNTTNNSITGIAIVKADGLTLAMVDVLDNPVTMSQNGNGFDYVPVASFVSPA